MSNQFNNCGYGCSPIGICDNPCDCVYSIKKALVSILKIFETYRYYNSDNISLLITLINGIEYTVDINKATLSDICIKGKLAKFGEIAISLCEISKIKVFIAPTTDPNIAKCIIAKLCSIANGDCECPCAYEECYLAITSYEGNSCHNQTSGFNNCCEYEGCANDVQRAIWCNISEISEVGFNGGLEGVTVSAIKGINTTTVLESISAVISTTTVVTDVSIIPSVTIVVNNVEYNEQVIVETVNIEAITVVTDVLSGNTSVVSGITASESEVVNGLNFLAPSTVVTGITVNPITVVTGVTPVPVTVVGAISTGEAEVVSGTDIVPTTVVGDITSTTALVITGITEVSEVSTKEISVPIMLVTGPFPVTLVVNVGGVDTPVLANGVPVVIDAISIVNVLELPAVLLAINGTPSVEEVVKTITPTKLQIANVSAPTLIPVINSVTVTEVSVVESITAPVATGVAGVIPIITTLTLVDNSKPTNTTIVSHITSIDTIPVINSVAPQYSQIDEVTEVVSTTINNISAIDNVQVINKLDTIITKGVGVSGVQLQPVEISIVESVDYEEVEVVIPASMPINGEILCIGNGIMVTQDTNGDICIYSICQINSFSTGI